MLTRDNFWDVLRKSTDYIIEKHTALNDEFGQEAADGEFSKALNIQSALMPYLSEYPRDNRLNLMLQGACLAVMATWLDFQAEDVEEIVLEGPIRPGAEPWSYRP